MGWRSVFQVRISSPDCTLILFRWWVSKMTVILDAICLLVPYSDTILSTIWWLDSFEPFEYWISKVYLGPECTYLVLLARLALTRSICWSTLLQSMAMMNLFWRFFLTRPRSMKVRATSWGCKLVLAEMSWMVICKLKKNVKIRYSHNLNNGLVWFTIVSGWECSIQCGSE